jgi:hypothetical protein
MRHGSCTASAVKTLSPFERAGEGELATIPRQTLTRLHLSQALPERPVLLLRCLGTGLYM